MKLPPRLTLAAEIPMKSYSRSQYTDDRLLSTFDSHLSLDLDNTADLLADLAEVDARKLYVPAAYGSMFDFCVHAKHMSEDVALKRIRVARMAREFPASFPALADGRLNQTAVLLLAPRLTADTADELLAAAAHRSKAEIELLLAVRFPKPDVPAVVQPLAPLGITGENVAPPADAPALELAPEPVVPSNVPNVPVPMEPLAPRAKLAPLSAGRYAVQFTIEQATYDKLRHAQALLGHALPSGDIAKVFERALDSLVLQLEKQKFAKCDRPRPQKGPAKGRHIPAAVKRAVRERDGGQCTFVSDKGRRCESRTRLELDHIEPVARGGESTTDNLRVRCRVHNQYEAERTFTPEFMAAKLAQAQAKADAMARANAKAKAHAAAEVASQQEVIPWLRALGCNAERARRAAERCAGMVGAPLERRVFVSCQGLGPRGMRRALPVASGPA